ncbi:MAG TPA: amino acid permease [Gemmatimonadaceae bacterium]|nr:amino acid permease [Gemmatimonadaceae bacterium]
MSRLSSEQSLVRAVGVWGLAANIVNLTIGGGIFRLPAAAASSLGPAAPVAYLACAAAMLLIVSCFAEAGSRVSLTGGPYVYAGVAFGPFIGLLCGALLMAGVAVATAAVASFFADSVVALFPAIGGGAGRAALIVVVLATLAVVNIAGLRGANRLNAFMTVAKLAPLAILVVAGLVAMNWRNVDWQDAPTPAAVTRASAIMIFAFLGVESALIPSGEVRNPARTVPRAVFLAVSVVAVVYLLVQLVAQGLLGAALAGQKTPLAEAAAVAMGPRGRMLILVGSSVSMLGYLAGMTFASPRMLFAFARDRFLPAPLASVHPRFRTPHVAIAVQTIAVMALSATGSFEKLAMIANGSVLMVYAICCLGVLLLRRRGVQQSDVPFTSPITRFAPIAAVAVIVWLLTGLSADEWKSIGLLIALLVAAYAVSSPARRATHVEETA